MLIDLQTQYLQRQIAMARDDVARVRFERQLVQHSEGVTEPTNVIHRCYGNRVMFAVYGFHEREDQAQRRRRMKANYWWIQPTCQSLCLLVSI